MKTFDYKRAWMDLAVPAYQNLSEHVRNAHHALAPLADACTQAHDCSLRYPTDADKLQQVKEILSSLTTEEMAHGSAIINACGHWNPSDARTACIARLFLLREYPGNTWKISLWMSQEIEKRLGLSHRMQDSGSAYRVQEGLLHMTYASKWCWMNRAVGFATEENLTRARKIFREDSAQVCRRKDDDKRIDAFEHKYERVKAELVCPEPLRGFVDPAAFMVEV